LDDARKRAEDDEGDACAVESLQERTGIEPTWSFPGTHAYEFIVVTSADP
jgi:hypothetical protein